LGELHLQVAGMRDEMTTKAPVRPDRKPAVHRKETATKASDAKVVAKSYTSPTYAGFWVTRRSGGVVCRHLDDLDAVVESGTCDELGQLICVL
jgi:hypothetical protein